MVLEYQGSSVYLQVRFFGTCFYQPSAGLVKAQGMEQIAKVTFVYFLNWQGYVAVNDWPK